MYIINKIITQRMLIYPKRRHQSLFRRLEMVGRKLFSLQITNPFGVICSICREPRTRWGFCRVSFRSGSRLNIKTVFPRYGDSHVKDKTVARPSYLWHGHPYTGKTTYFYIETAPSPRPFFKSTSPSAVKQPWSIWVNHSHTSAKNEDEDEIIQTHVQILLHLR